MGAALPQRQQFAFTVWGLRDTDSWLRREPEDDGRDQPLLFDALGRAKPLAAALEQARDAAAFETVVERWGIRRSHPLFWVYFHDLSRYIHETDPVEEGVLDMNRYENL